MRGDTALLLCGSLLSPPSSSPEATSLLSSSFSLSSTTSLSPPFPSLTHFEGFNADDETLDDSLHLIDLPLRSPTPPTITQSDTTESDHGPPDQTPFSADSDIPSKPSMSSFEYWDEDEFEGLPVQYQPPEIVNLTDSESNLDLKIEKTGSVMRLTRHC
ncbi:unnamed protein product [Camellia sinensis]